MSERTFRLEELSDSDSDSDEDVSPSRSPPLPPARTAAAPAAAEAGGPLSGEFDDGILVGPLQLISSSSSSNLVLHEKGNSVGKSCTILYDSCSTLSPYSVLQKLKDMPAEVGHARSQAPLCFGGEVIRDKGMQHRAAICYPDRLSGLTIGVSRLGLNGTSFRVRSYPVFRVASGMGSPGKAHAPGRGVFLSSPRASS